ncbi:MAG: bifunctional UDP-N-acetylglucosamine diphosphorylase/glucosamine-1-phosphate N-acetyltransferase GlmU [Acidobacteriota bacterium]
MAALDILVLAAGRSKRMRSKTSKLLHPLWGRPLITWVLDALQPLKPRRQVVVLGYQAGAVREALAAYPVETVIQDPQRGTGDAVLTARPQLDPDGDLLILNADLPLLSTSVLSGFVDVHHASSATLSLLTTELADPDGYGRIVRAGGQVSRIVEDRDADASERAIREINCGVYLARAAAVLPALDALTPDNAQGEYYLTDLVASLGSSGESVAAVVHPEPREVLGVNDRADLAEAFDILRRRKLAALMSDGVTILDPAHTYIDPRARIGADTVIYPGVWVEGESVIGECCVVRPDAHLDDVQIGNRVTIKNSCVVTSSQIGDHAQVGPFAHLRPGTFLSEKVKVGNFVETKKTVLGPGSKASHLTYLGDAELGAGVNVGAGTITCNYDGKAKHRTVMEDGVFIGSDTQLVAPVRIGAGAYVGAGTTVTEDVPPGALAVSRARQRNIEGWVERHQAGSGQKAGGKKDT